MCGIPQFRMINAAFTYAHPQGSRFNGPERGAWYCSFELETALAEVAFHKSVEYEEIGRFGTQTERMLSIFPASQVKIILYDDFAAAPGRVYDEVIQFLDLPHDHRTVFPRINENKRAKVAWLKHFFQKPPPVLRSAIRGLKRAVGAEELSALKTRLVQMNTVKERRAPMPPALRAELVETFREEVALLSRLLSRDLSHWR